MIYDGHAYIFPDVRGDGGFSKRAEYQQHLQLAIASHFQGVFRKQDRKTADNSGLIDSSKPRGFEALKDANFQATEFGRFEWESNGEEYVKQYMPPSVVDMTFTAHDLVAEMDYAQVERALIHRTPYLGIDEEFIANGVATFPDRLQGLAYVPEWTITSNMDVAIERLERSINELGLHGRQLLPDHLILYDQSPIWNAAEFKPFWDAFATMRVPLFITPGYSTLAPGASGRGMDLGEMKIITEFMEAYPDIPTVLTHGLSWRSFADKDGIRVPNELYDALPLDNPNFHLQLLFAIFFGGEWDYPMPQIKSVLEEVVDRVGVSQLQWGTDIPMVMRFQTYRQSLDSLRHNLDFLSQAEVDAICGDNAARLMGVA